MQILIIGCGNVGLTLAISLCEAKHDVTVMDINSERLSKATEQYDIMGICANGLSTDEQLEAGIRDTDLMIAVTESDEKNLLCCLIARRYGNCNTIARVRASFYGSEADFLKKELGLSLLINPEFNVAQSIARIIKYPAAMKVDSFVRGRMELSSYRIKGDNPLCGMTVRDIFSKFRLGVLICMIQRDEDVLIPDGNTVIRQNDIIFVTSDSKSIRPFLKKVKLASSELDNIFIVGGSTTTEYLAEILRDSGVSVTIIERNRSRCDELSSRFPEATILHGDGTDAKTLAEEGISGTQAVVCLTDIDETNLMVALYAKSASQAKVITRVHRLSFIDLINKLDPGTVIYPQSLVAESVQGYVRALDNAKGSNVETLYRLVDGKAEALEFSVGRDSPVVGIPLKKLETRDNLLIAGIFHHGRCIIPGGNDVISAGDSVIVITTHVGLGDIAGILK